MSLPVCLEVMSVHCWGILGMCWHLGKILFLLLLSDHFIAVQFYLSEQKALLNDSILHSGKLEGQEPS